MDFIYILLKAVVFIVQQIHEMMREICFVSDNLSPSSATSSLRYRWWWCAQSLMRSPKRGARQKLRPVLPGHPERLCREEKGDTGHGVNRGQVGFLTPLIAPRCSAKPQRALIHAKGELERHGWNAAAFPALGTCLMYWLVLLSSPCGEQPGLQAGRG